MKTNTFILKIKVKDLDPNQDDPDDNYINEEGATLVKEYIEQVIDSKLKEYYDVEIEKVEIIETGIK